MLLPGWSAKVEYLYFDFGHQTATLTGGAGVFPYSNHLMVNTIKFGINYHFNLTGLTAPSGSTH